MKKYIFFTPAIRNIGGAELYISQKIKWLKDNKWKTYIFFQHDGEIVIENLKEYKDNCIPSLGIHYSIANRRCKKKILNTILDRIQLQSNDTVIFESSLLSLSLWAEFVAQKICAKHLVFLLSESLGRYELEHRKFIGIKIEQDALFCIKEKILPGILGNSTLYKNRELKAIGCFQEY